MEMQHTIFEYLYRDASNYKSWGALLLAGSVSQDYAETLTDCLETDNLFIAEQVGVPPLYRELWALSGGKTEDDHAYHEFIELRPASADEIQNMTAFMKVDDFLQRFRSVGRHWDCRNSLNCAFG